MSALQLLAADLLLAEDSLDAIAASFEDVDCDLADLGLDALDAEGGEFDFS